MKARITICILIASFVFVNVASAQTCEEMLAQVTSQECLDQAYATIEEAKTCIMTCVYQGGCLSIDCLLAYYGQTPACLPSVYLIYEQCGDCTMACSELLFGCLIDPAKTGADCLTEGTECLENCLAPSVLEVGLDIKPGSDPNCINLSSNGVVPIAILGSATLDVTQIDTSSVIFGGGSVKVVGKKNKELAAIEDVNADGIPDLSLKIEDQDGWSFPGEGEATVSGALLDGTAFVGTDTLCIVP